MTSAEQITPDNKELSAPQSDPKKEIERPIETPQQLKVFVEKVESQVVNLSNNIVDSGTQQVEPIVLSIGGGTEDVTAGKATLKKVTAQIKNLNDTTKHQIEKVGQPETESQSIRLDDNYTPEQLAEFRAKTKDDYGEGLVSKHHKGKNTLAEHEAAQTEAYHALKAKIDAGAVRPDSIQSDMLVHLGLNDATEVTISNIEQTTQQISSEIKGFTERELIKEEEADLIYAEIQSFIKIYTEAFPEVNQQQVFEIARDNARKLAYQTERDKQVFSGSDHGTRHILEGNMRMADKMLESLGDKVSAKDKTLIHQIIIDHDLGYTVGAAQAKGSFDASKDHPLFSAKFIEANQAYYKKMFGDSGYKIIQQGILQHIVNDINSYAD